MNLVIGCLLPLCAYTAAFHHVLPLALQSEHHLSGVTRKQTPVVFLMQTLMDQAAWNLCPVSGVSSGTSCYYANDQTFTDLSGTLTVTIDDCPDGRMQLPPRRLALHQSAECASAMPCCTASRNDMFLCAVSHSGFFSHAYTQCGGLLSQHLSTEQRLLR